ncbi:uncharacterized protein LOC124155494 [Ischnura elegans]|uniref:uncharacterized protein LOC124155494 n=1 Tax=Ischnura elegans TaxID=197161 RepID=UPI001ED8A191|nr:uncharacterized protein LOC124155494 [Ischnura elegans]XP_046385307.1 uncharacterized protein LOC124155494 [Ischnura elegans]XP_046385308.1 uncharacterized protein LOC124155494 [Ischnura elegans]XP_046385309.1 uncharacterized protein LOC124155494 [Ischnura elegans]
MSACSDEDDDAMGGGMEEGVFPQTDDEESGGEEEEEDALVVDEDAVVHSDGEMTGGGAGVARSAASRHQQHRQATPGAAPLMSKAAIMVGGGVLAGAAGGGSSSGDEEGGSGGGGSVGGGGGGEGTWLPQCKIKRNYICHCNYFTQNPRLYLYHLRDVHGERIRVYECPNCLYASKHSQKLQRHIHMVHVVGSTKGGGAAGNNSGGGGSNNATSGGAPKSTVSARKGGGASSAEKKRPAAVPAMPALGGAAAIGMVPPSQAAAVDVDDEEEAEMAGSEFGAQSPSSSSQTFSCSACSFSSRSRSLVMRHEHIAHVLKKRFFRCGKCSYATHVKARYTKHVKYHSMPMIKCERCDFRTPYKWNLDRHCKNHLSDPSANTPGAFRCPICDFSADIKQSLTVHVQNHHLSPEQVQARAARRRNKVGASDSAEAEAAAISGGGNIDSEEMELLRMEREENYFQGATYGRMSLDSSRSSLLQTPDEPTRVSTPSSSGSNKLKVTLKKMRGPSATQEQNERHNFRTDFIHPDDIIHKNGQVYIKTLKCNYCNFKAAWDGDILRHESKAHGIEHPKPIPKSSPVVVNNKKCPRPVPNLIPIQGKTPAAPVSPSASTNLPILRIPTLKGRAMNEEAPSQNEVEVTMSDKDMNALINAESSRNSALKDFASLIGDLPDDADGNSRPSTPSKNSTAADGGGEGEEPAGTPETVKSDPTSISPPTPSKKTCASFFDRLKERLLVGAGDGLVCEICGHESKCLSEKARHQKLHDSTPEGTQVEDSVTPSSTPGEKNRLIPGGNAALMALSSTRCQHCRQRCKTSADLMVHLQSCLNSTKDDKGEGEDDEEDEARKAKKAAVALEDEKRKSLKAQAEAAKEAIKQAIKESMEGEDDEEGGDEDEDEGEDGEPHPMENKVFVWNNCAQSGEGSGSGGMGTQASSASDGEGTGAQSGEDLSGAYAEDGEGLVGVETAPGIGAITGRGGFEGGISPGGKVTMKKVFKCPQCPFWASTASRFHVHAVGHLNRKPFECSACGYRSNWRWDITKHIRLRAAWDEAHRSPPEGSDGSGPRVLMTDETGRRNYSKYNRHLTVVRVHEMLSSEQGTGGEGSPLSSPLPQGTPVENGKMVHKSMVMLLPAPPRLTPAPIQAANVSEDGESTPPLLRPPPPLRAAASSTAGARRPNLVNAGGESQLSGEGGTARGVKRPATSVQGGGAKEGGSTKRTLWKCKKCNYRDASRELILAHVRQHYAAPQQHPPSRPPPPLQQQPKTYDKSEQKMDMEDGGEPMDIGGDDPLPVGKGGDIKPYQCGHCGRISNWKHVIQRHCRLKHNGDVLVIEHPNTVEEDNMDPSNSWKCDKCPYRAADLIELQTHATHHIQRPGAVFKCSFCPYFVFERTHLVGHMRLHTESMLSKSLDHQDEQEEPTKEEMKKNDGSEGGKRYSCVGCPYVSDSKSQFLYHKQFHRPRGVSIPFKCSFCSYGVSRRHLLHQHLRVHGVFVPPNMRDDEPRIDATKRSSASRLSQPVLDTSRLADVPLVWVSRAGKFQKMFKCRFCPHVNVRKINIQEHEKMHKQRKTFPVNPRQGQLMSGMDSPQGNSPKVGASPHKCPQCNYSCNNAGVLSAHAKVHLDSYGKVHCLVDVNRADEEQIAELEANTMMGGMEPSDSDDVGVTVGGMNRNANGIGGTSNSSGVGGSGGIGGGVTNSVIRGGQASPEEDFAECAPEVPDNSVESPEGRVLHFCPSCPARFVFERELVIHRRFHGIRLPFKCEACSYAARQRPHLLAHLKVHTREYQEKSAALIANHSVSSHHPRPRIATALPNDAMNPESMWIVDPKPAPSPQVAQETSTEAPQSTANTSLPATQPNKHYACDRCPARFFKSVALQYHLTLHGGPGPYHCRTCDYAVKTYGNLVRHEMIHSSGETPNNRNTSVSHNSPTIVPLSGTDLFRQREAAGQAENIPTSPTTQAPTQVTPSSVPPTVDPQFGTLMHGNPDFIYPTYFKNGKLKEKRYKCHKCPSAFEKREQYKVHLSLHGSKQRYRCDKCDYAVKYCANYIQHVRKHTKCEEARLARQQQQQQNDSAGVVQNLKFDSPSMPMPVTPAPPPPSSSHSSPSRPVKSIAPVVPPALSMAEKQQALLRRLRLEAAGAQEREEEERRKRNVFLCLRCPYNTHRKDSLEAHMRRHPGASELSVGSSQFPCPFCDYAAPQSHFLREHIKLHFRATKTLPKPEAYLSIEKMEVWEGENREDGSLIFRDTGKEGFERFLPPDDGSEMEEGADESGRTYVDPESGEILQASEVSSESSAVGQTGEEAVEVKDEDASETKGKDLGGDWTIDVLDEDDSSRDGDEVESKAMECASVD